MKIKYLLAVLYVFSLLEAKTQVLTINELIEMALIHSPNIDSSRLDFKLAKQRIKISEGLYLPHLDLTIDGSKQGIKFKQQSLYRADVLLGTLSASQLLYDFGKTVGKIKTSNQEALALYAQMQQIISDKILLVKKSYYDILKIKAMITINHKNIKLLEEQYSDAVILVTSGIKTNIDLVHIKVKLDQAHFELDNTKYELEYHRINLEHTIGYTPNNGNYILYSEKITVAYLSKKLPIIKTPLNQLELFAYNHRYIMQSSKYTLKAAQSNVKSAQGDYYPTILLNGQYDIQDVNSIEVGILPERSTQIGIHVNWNIFSGYQTSANIEMAKITVLKNVSKLQDIRLLIKKQVKESYVSVRENQNNIKLSIGINKRSLKKFTEAQERYENEHSHYIELEEAHQGYILSLTNLVNHYYNYFFSIAQLDHAIGK